MNPLERLRPVSALTFDCYGTLVDWEAGILACLGPLLAGRGARLKPERILRLYAELETEAESGPYRPYREVLAAVARGFGARLGFTPSAEEEGALAASLPSWRPFPDTVAALRRLSRRFRLAVVSNVDPDLFEETRRQLQAEFSPVVTAREARGYKPAPRHFELALEGLGLPRERVLHVAQSIFHDVAPARELGLSTAWVNRRRGRRGTGATPRAKAVPDLEVPDLKTLADLLC